MKRMLIAALSALYCTHAAADVRAVDTVVLGPFTGHHAPLHPDNAKIDYYGTDLGWTYVHKGTLHFLFGDTWKSERGEPIDPVRDDVYGTIDLKEWPQGTRVSATSIPRVKFGMKANARALAPLDYGMPAQGLKTPVGAFSNGEHEFAMFITGKPLACKVDADCPSDFTCETSVGFFGERPDTADGLTLACEEGSTGCIADTLFDQTNKPIPNSGLCADATSSLWTDTPSGRTSATTMEHFFAVRDTKDASKYRKLTNWHTNKFINVAIRTVDDFDPARGSGHSRQNYRNVATTSGPTRRVLLFGRPEFIGVNAKDQSLAMYFAFADMPRAPDFEWKVNYFAGIDSDGALRFSTKERDAVAIDLDASRPGVQPKEVHDVVAHMSVVWIDALKKWVMFYGGGTSDLPSPPFAPTCGLLEISARTECKHVDMGNGAIRMRVADDPWGPWTPPQDIFVGGDPKKRPTELQFAPGGVLHHPECAGEKCQSRSPSLPKGDYGWLYGANIIEPWIVPTSDGADVIWNASTWNPYRVILLKTRISQH